MKFINIFKKFKKKTKNSRKIFSILFLFGILQISILQIKTVHLNSSFVTLPPINNKFQSVSPTATISIKNYIQGVSKVSTNGGKNFFLGNLSIF